MEKVLPDANGWRAHYSVAEILMAECWDSSTGSTGRGL
jgi:hypothetical protein